MTKISCWTFPFITIHTHITPLQLTIARYRECFKYFVNERWKKGMKKNFSSRLDILHLCLFPLSLRLSFFRTLSLSRSGVLLFMFVYVNASTTTKVFIRPIGKAHSHTHTHAFTYTKLVVCQTVYIRQSNEGTDCTFSCIQTLQTHSVEVFCFV